MGSEYQSEVVFGVQEALQDTHKGRMAPHHAPQQCAPARVRLLPWRPVQGRTDVRTKHIHPQQHDPTPRLRVSPGSNVTHAATAHIRSLMSLRHTSTHTRRQECIAAVRRNNPIASSACSEQVVCQTSRCQKSLSSLRLGKQPQPRQRNSCMDVASSPVRRGHGGVPPRHAQIRQKRNDHS